MEHNAYVIPLVYKLLNEYVVSTMKMIISMFCGLQSLLLLGCFALFWSLYYTLEVTLTHWDWRGCSMTRTGRDRGFQAASMGLEDSQVVEIQPELDNEAKVPLIAADENT